MTRAQFPRTWFLIVARRLRKVAGNMAKVADDLDRLRTDQLPQPRKPQRNAYMRHYKANKRKAAHDLQGKPAARSGA